MQDQESPSVLDPRSYAHKSEGSECKDAAPSKSAYFSAEAAFGMC